MIVRRSVVQRFWRGFFWGPPSHKRIAWVGALAGIAVFGLAWAVFGHVSLLLTLGVLLMGAAEFGWAVELAPTSYARMAGWGRLARWLCAVAGTLAALLSLLLGQATVAWFALVIAGTGVLLAFEMAPGGPANRPR